MLSQDSETPQVSARHPVNSAEEIEDDAARQDDRRTQRRIRIRIPKHYHSEPVISRLVSDYHLIVNITAAILGANANGDGWFDLELEGSETQINHGLMYLDELDLELWKGSEADGW